MSGVSGDLLKGACGGLNVSCECCMMVVWSTYWKRVKVRGL